MGHHCIMSFLLEINSFYSSGARIPLFLATTRIWRDQERIEETACFLLLPEWRLEIGKSSAAIPSEKRGGKRLADS